MAALSSASQAKSTSMLSLNQRQTKIRQSKDKDAPFMSPKDAKCDMEISTCVQVLLASCSLGIEMCATFIQIFAVLYLQFLGVPTALVSMNGVISGASSLVLLPIVGWFSDRGSNPVARKLMTMFLSLTVYLLGLSGLSLCGVLKIMYFNEILNEDGANRTNTAIERANITIRDTFENRTSGIKPWIGLTDETPAIPQLGSESTFGDTTIFGTIPASGYLAIVCFGLLDIGFDISMALSRAFMLECVPSSLHTRLLLIASVIQSSSGLVFAFISTIDFSGHLARIFGVNGTAATIVLYGVFLSTVVLIGFSCTMITGFYLLWKKQVGLDNLSTNKARKRDSASDHVKQNDKFSRLWKNRFPRKSTLSSVERVKDTESMTRPLLADGCCQSSNYLSVSFDTATAFNTVEEGTNKTNVGAVEEDNQSHMSFSTSNESSKLAAEKLDSYQQGAQSLSGSVKNPFEVWVAESMAPKEDYDIAPRRRIYEGEHHTDDAITALGAFKASYSTSVSMVHSTFAHEPCLKNLIEIPNASKRNHSAVSKSPYNKRLIILCISSFLTIGSMICSITFTGNALTLDIYHGVPTALPGTDGYRLYKKGLTNAAWGNFAMYAVFTLVSLANKKIIDLIGEKMQFTVSHLIFIICYLCLLLVKNEELFFVSMSVSGLSRACVYTLPYILANKFTQEEAGATNGNSSSMQRGKVMTLIGFLIPLHYLAVSTMMGPLMEATGNVWVPTIYSVVTATVATFVFALLFVVKD